MTKSEKAYPANLWGRRSELETIFHSSSHSEEQRRRWRPRKALRARLVASSSVGSVLSLGLPLVMSLGPVLAPVSMLVLAPVLALVLGQAGQAVSAAS